MQLVQGIDLHLLILSILEDINTTGGSRVIFEKCSLGGEWKIFCLQGIWLLRRGLQNLERTIDFDEFCKNVIEKF